MNLTKLLGLFLCVLIFASAISVVNADITIDYGETSFKDAYGSERFRFRVRMTVETEENNEWLPNKIYDITFNITLTFVNQTMTFVNQSRSTFVLESLRFFDLGGINVSYAKLDYDTYLFVNQAESRSIHAQASSVQDPLEKPCIKPYMYYQIDYVPYANDKVHPNRDTVYQWSTDEITYIEVGTPPSLLSPEFLIVASGIIIGAVAVAGYILVKTSKKKRRN